jgi:hypothetical protein
MYVCIYLHKIVPYPVVHEYSIKKGKIRLPILILIYLQIDSFVKVEKTKTDIK